MSSPTNSELAASGVWRASVLQSQRNNEVREISRELAALEPGASAASKLRLAMQFEDTIFKSATSFSDYKKKLTKRLKKLQKKYVPPAQPAGTSSTEKQNQLMELRQTYGESLRYILKYAEKAVEEMKTKQGEEKSLQLRQHTDAVKTWAADLGIVEGTKLNLTMSDDQLQRLREHLERRAENIRQHVVKLVDSDQFMLESLQKLEDDSRTPNKARGNAILGEATRRRYEHSLRNSSQAYNGEDSLQKALKEAQIPVPLQTRNQEDQGRQVALLHLKKMRATSNVLMAYMAIKDKEKIPQGTLAQAHKIATAGINVVQEVMGKLRKDLPDSDVTLEDAWMKQLVLQQPEGTATETKEGEPLSPPAKRRRIVSATRSRVLLTARRKTPSNLIPALKRKRARLIRPPGEGSHLQLEFGSAFILTIYFVPLIVVIRAKDVSTTQTDVEEQSSKTEVFSATTSQFARWTPLHSGLTNRSYDGPHRLSLWGTKGDYDSLGPLVQERLRDASAHATYILRQCFGKAAQSSNDFETEIREATALLEFIQLARTTYMPNWQDYDG